MTAPIAISYRRTKTGEWVAYGPAAEVKPGPVCITKANGDEKLAIVDRVGRPFTVDGAQMVYGYLVDGARRIMADADGYSYSQGWNRTQVAVYDHPREVPIGGTRDPRHIVTVDDILAGLDAANA